MFFFGEVQYIIISIIIREIDKSKIVWPVSFQFVKTFLENNFSRDKKTHIVWSPEHFESLNRRSMNQLANVCKTNKKAAVVSPPPL